MLGEPDTDVDTLLRETLDFLTVRPGPEPGTWVGDPPAGSDGVLFGGFVIAQAIVAATRDAPAGRRLHSLHAYFLRPASTDAPVDYSVRALRDGRSFNTRRVEVTQQGKAMLDLTASFTADTDGYVYDLPSHAAVGAPEVFPGEPGPGPWVAGFVGPTPERSDGTRESTHRNWFRIPAPLPDDPHIHTALLGFASDWTGTGGRPHDLDGDTTGMVSLDHAVWFHRPARPDEWLLYDVQSLVNAGGRGLLRGVMRDRDGQVVASAAQEMRLTPVRGSAGATSE